MRFMVIVKANADSEAGAMPTSAQLAAMGRYNEQLIDAGIMLAGEGLHPSSKGARIAFGEKGASTVKDGPFTEAKELVAGFWILQVKSLEDAIAWARRAPMEPGDELEIRQVFETADFDADPITEEHLRKEQEFRDRTQKPVTN
ncbi:MAG: hypothetical protein BGO82_19430 [Devosia sp. 67-54]|mgnify:CR=1 FL=1|uniref:YciI family protein n=1 Tax=unclassified Devosia TaxID=196773 RepID=UPI00095A6D47|nr:MULTISPECIES: YciI family protein [unclassified Devosia]MBN9306265.1 YciI family protein [Devosia sp.]OJX18339.1 MAG: hypothetical protein BGO82_19430 [Devosia sp. 67-54]